MFLLVGTLNRATWPIMNDGDVSSQKDQEKFKESCCVEKLGLIHRSNFYVCPFKCYFSLFSWKVSGKNNYKMSNIFSENYVITQNTSIMCILVNGTATDLRSVSLNLKAALIKCHLNVLVCFIKAHF